MKQKSYRAKWRCRAVSVMFVSGCLIAPNGQGAAVPSQSGPNTATNVLTLEMAIRVALENNPQLQASRARVDAANGRADQAKKWTNPQLQMNADEWPVNSGRGFSDSIRTIGISQTLPYPGKKALDKRIGGMGVMESAAAQALRRTELVRDVKTEFYKVLATERLIEVSTQLVAVAQSSATAARQRVEAGAAPYQEQLRAEVQLVQAQAESREWGRELAAVRREFVTVLGRPDLKDTRLSGNLAQSPKASLVQKTGSEFLAQHPGSLAAQASLERIKLEYRRARLEPYPDVTVGLSGGVLGETDQSIVQLGISVPIPILDTFKGKKREARANVREAEAELQAMRQQLLREWANAQGRYRTAAEQAASYREQALPKADEALRLVQTGFDEGKFSFIDLVDTQRTVAEVRLAYLQKLLELNVAEAEVEALLAQDSTLPMEKAPRPQTEP